MRVLTEPRLRAREKAKEKQSKRGVADKDGLARKTEGIQERTTNERKRGTKGREKASTKTEWQKEIRWKKLEQLPPLESTATTANRHYRLRNPHQGSTVSHSFLRISVCLSSTNDENPNPKHVSYESVSCRLSAISSIYALCD